MSLLGFVKSMLMKQIPAGLIGTGTDKYWQRAFSILFNFASRLKIAYNFRSTNCILIFSAKSLMLTEVNILFSNNYVGTL